MAETVSDNFANRVQKPLHLPDDAPELLTSIDALLIKKQGAPEMGLAPQAPILNRSIEAGLRRLESAHIGILFDQTLSTGSMPYCTKLSIVDKSDSLQA